MLDPIFQAMRKAGVSDPSKCLFVDDNRRNVDAACELGWRSCVHFCEQGLENMEGGQIRKIGADREVQSENRAVVIQDLEELRTVWKEVFVDSASS